LKGELRCVQRVDRKVIREEQSLQIR
jgi:hypothetical protein